MTQDDLEMDERTLQAMSEYGLPAVAHGDRIEFLEFGAPDHYFDHQTQSYQPIPGQLEPGTLGTVTGVGPGQLLVDWDTQHTVMLVVGPFGIVAKEGFLPDRFRLLAKAPPGPPRRTSALAERAVVVPA